MIIRPACSAGNHYPADADELITTIAKLLLAYPIANVQPFALVVPHNAINNSGEIAAAAYRHLSKMSSVIEQVVIISGVEEPQAGIFLPSCDKFNTPLGGVDVNRDVTRQLLRLPFVETNDTVHYHSARIEVQLPFLQTCLTDFNVVPILVGDVPHDELSLFFHSLPRDERTITILSLDVMEDEIAAADLGEQVLFVSFLEYCEEVSWKVQPALAETESTNQKVAVSFVAH